MFSVMSRKKVVDMKSGRRKSPISARKHGERGEKGGGTVLFTPGNSNTNIITAASSLTLPATPSTQSLMSTLDDRGHVQHSLATPASQDTSVVATIAGGTVPKTAEELSLHDEDQVKIQFYLAFVFSLSYKVLF